MNIEWNTVKIGDLGKIITGKTPPTDQKRYYGCEFPFITPSDIPYFGIKYIDKTERFLTSDWATRSKNYLLPKDSICVVCIGSTIGKTCVTTEDSFTNQQINSIIVNDKKFDSSFVFYSLLNVIDKFKNIGASSGAGKGIVNKSTFSELSLDVPDHNIQSEIASIISSYDDLVKNNKKRIQILEFYASRYYQLLFTNSGNFALGKKTSIKLGEFVMVKKGKNITRKTAVAGSVPVVAGGLEPAYYHNTSNTTGPVITISASGANAGFVNLYHEDIWASDCSYIDSTMTPYLIFIYLFLKNNQSQITNLQKGSAQPHVYPKDIMSLDFMILDSKVLDEFSEIVNKIYTEIGILELANQKLTKMRELVIMSLIAEKKPLKI